MPVFIGPVNVPLTSTVASPVLAPELGDVIVTLREPVPVMSCVRPGDAKPPVSCDESTNVVASNPLLKMSSIPQNSEPAGMTRVVFVERGNGPVCAGGVDGGGETPNPLSPALE